MSIRIGVSRACDAFYDRNKREYSERQSIKHAQCCQYIENLSSREGGIANSQYGLIPAKKGGAFPLGQITDI